MCTTKIELPLKVISVQLKKSGQVSCWLKAVDLSINQARDLHSSEDVALYIETVAKFYLKAVSIKAALEYSIAQNNIKFSK